MRTVYIETTIPCYYNEIRPDPEAQAKRAWTRRWWDDFAPQFHCVTSTAVLHELAQGDYPIKETALGLVSGLPVLQTEPAIAEIVEAYIRHHVMPANPFGDALHLAIASYHKCDFLLTWNCKHLANANKFGHIRRVNVLLGLFVPDLVTPLELSGEQDAS
jgi:predicted nucleic acid-binding protein